MSFLSLYFSGHHSGCRILCRSRKIPIACLALGSLLLAGCSGGDSSPSREKLLAEYVSFADSVGRKTPVPSQDLAQVLLRWHGLERSLFAILETDTTNRDANLSTLAAMSEAGNRVSALLEASADSRVISWQELSDVQKEVSRHMQGPPGFLSEAQSFYEALPVSEAGVTARQSELDYLDFLRRMQDRGYSSWAEIVSMLREEDGLYQDYLASTPGHPASVIEEIVLATNTLMTQVTDCLKGDREKEERLLAYMSARTNRRLLLCAEDALARIENGQCSSLQESASAVSGAMAPFVYFSPLLAATRSRDQEKRLEDIAHRMPAALKGLTAKGLGVTAAPDSLPGRILKDYMSYVINN